MANFLKVGILQHSPLKEYFEVVDENGKNIKLKCKHCLPANKILSAAKCTPANLFKHVEVSIFGSSL